MLCEALNTAGDVVVSVSLCGRDRVVTTSGYARLCVLSGASIGL